MGLGKLLSGVRGHDRYLAWNRLEAAPAIITLTSPSFADGEAMPARHAGLGVGENRSPALTLSGVPEAARALVLVLQDPDAPIPRPVVHMIAHLPPETATIGEGCLNLPPVMPLTQAIGFGRASFGRKGYHGPRPVPGHGPHRYIFQVFAVDLMPNFTAWAGLNLKQHIAAMGGHVVARGRLTGTFTRP